MQDKNVFSKNEKWRNKNKAIIKLDVELFNSRNIGKKI